MSIFDKIFKKKVKTGSTSSNITDGDKMPAMPKEFYDEHSNGEGYEEEGEDDVNE